jgi:hypothetical protein
VDMARDKKLIDVLLVGQANDFPGKLKFVLKIFHKCDCRSLFELTFLNNENDTSFFNTKRTTKFFSKQLQNCLIFKTVGKLKKLSYRYS